MKSKSDFPKLKNPAVLSPMAGVTDVAFRTLCKHYGAGLTYTEFVSSTAIVRGNERSLHLLQTDPSEIPVAVQLFGSSVEDVVKAAQTIEDDFDIIDINCGCPAWKVIKTGAGSSLLKDPEKIASFVNKLASSISKPVTVKIRKGIDDNFINAVEVAKVVEDAGAAAIAIHGRTQSQGYSGVADWEIIKEVKEAINIPVIGNGDVTTPEQFAERLEQSGVDAIMIARAAMRNPYIFKQIEDFQKTGSYQNQNQIETFFQLLPITEQYNMQFKDLKQHAVSLTKGMEGGSKLREALAKTQTKEQLVSWLKEVR